MERLTDKGGTVLGCLSCNEECDGLCMRVYKATTALAAYEDTNMTPDQIRKIDIWYREQATKLVCYMDAILEAAKGNPDEKLYLKT